MSHDVFISYKSEELDIAMTVKQRLEANGVKCWMAPDSIPRGSSYMREIPKAIRRCKIVILMLSTASQQSEWISKEMGWALNSRKVVLPFRIENCELTDEYGFCLNNVQYYNAYVDFERFLNELTIDVKSLFEQIPDLPEEPSSSELGGKRLVSMMYENGKSSPILFFVACFLSIILTLLIAVLNKESINERISGFEITALLGDFLLINRSTLILLALIGVVTSAGMLTIMYSFDFFAKLEARQRTALRLAIVVIGSVIWNIGVYALIVISAELIVKLFFLLIDLSVYIVAYIDERLPDSIPRW